MEIIGDEYCTCCDCGGTFVITQGERQFLTSKNLSKPRRCRECRAERRRQREQA